MDFVKVEEAMKKYKIGVELRYTHVPSSDSVGRLIQWPHKFVKDSQISYLVYLRWTQDFCYFNFTISVQSHRVHRVYLDLSIYDPG